MDYLELYRRYGAMLQTGGSDQWGNLTAGVDLIRRVEGVIRPCPGDAARHARGRHQVRQDRDRGHLPGPGDDLALRLLPVLPQPGRCGRRPAPQGLQLPLPRGDHALASGRRRARRRRARRSRSWRVSSPHWSTATTRRRQAVAASEALFGRATCTRSTSGALAAAARGAAHDPAISRRDASGPGAAVATGLAQSRGRRAPHRRRRAVPTSTTGA